jgi:hypothetical protein
MTRSQRSGTEDASTASLYFQTLPLPEPEEADKLSPVAKKREPHRTGLGRSCCETSTGRESSSDFSTASVAWQFRQLLLTSQKLSDSILFDAEEIYRGSRKTRATPYLQTDLYQPVCWLIFVWVKDFSRLSNKET